MPRQPDNSIVGSNVPPPPPPPIQAGQHRTAKALRRCLETLRLADAKREVRNLSVLGMRPDLPAEWLRRKVKRRLYRMLQASRIRLYLISGTARASGVVKAIRTHC